MINDIKVEKLARTFKIFGDNTRIKILNCMIDKECCVQEIATTIGMTQSAVSHQLSILKDARLVKSMKAGKEVYYSIDDSHIISILDVVLDHIEEEEKYGRS